jgi:PiT family inorganic phosphate transporter
MILTPIIIAVIVLALIFDFLNGVHDSSNVVATMISSRALSPRLALLMTAMAEFSGPLIFGVAVANTIGNEVVIAEAINTNVLLAALSSAILWNILTWILGFPSSSSHALVGGFVGAVVIGAGWQAIQLPGIEKILIALFASPLIGFAFGYILLRLVLLLSWKDLHWPRLGTQPRSQRCAENHGNYHSGSGHRWLFEGFCRPDLGHPD